jgi:hypothetical protein
MQNHIDLPPPPSRLAALLTGASLGVTFGIAGALVVSPWWGAAIGTVSAASLVGTLASFRSGESDVRDAALPLVLAAIALETVLAACRYAAGVPAQLARAAAQAFVPRFPLGDATWFVVFVVLPVSTMLFGAHALSRRHPLGVFMAWWTALYAAAETLAQVRLVLLAGANPFWNLAGGVVAAVQALVALAIAQRLLRPHVRRAASSSPPLTARQRNLWSLLFVAAVVIYGATLFVEAGPLPVGVIIGSMMGGLIGWRKTTSKRPADPAIVLPTYLLLLGLFYVHVGEEALTSFNRAIAATSGTAWSDHDFTMFIGLAGPILWFASAWSLWHRQPFGNFVLWFLIVGMILGEPTHLLVFPFVAMHRFGIGYQYFSGMYTALFPMVPAIVALVAIVRDHRGRSIGAAS